MLRMGCLKYASRITAEVDDLEPAERLGYALEVAEVFEDYVLDLEDELGD